MTPAVPDLGACRASLPGSHVPLLPCKWMTEDLGVRKISQMGRESGSLGSSQHPRGHLGSQEPDQARGRWGNAERGSCSACLLWWRLAALGGRLVLLLRTPVSPQHLQANCEEAALVGALPLPFSASSLLCESSPSTCVLTWDAHTLGIPEKSLKL